VECRPAQSRERALEIDVGGEATEENGEEGLALHRMKLDIPDDELELITKALDHYHAYTVARNAEDRRFRDLADRLKRKPTEREPTTQSGKNTKRRA
jgi:hypothetical protein